MLEKPYIIEGGLFTDSRGVLAHVNDFVMDDVRRFYVIHQGDVSVIRGWHAHQFEKKYFYVVKGSFVFGLVRIDNWENPSIDLKADTFILSDKKSEVLCVPEGYANAVKAMEPGSEFIVLSNKTLSEAANDSWRYDKALWVDWNKF